MSNPIDMSSTSNVTFLRRSPDSDSWIAFCPYCARKGEVVKRNLVWSPGRGVMHCFCCGRGGLVVKLTMPKTGVCFERSVEL